MSDAPIALDEPELDDAAKARLTSALDQASDELGLVSYYRDCVRPILKQPREQWPRCCGGGCDPCSQLLIQVAERVQGLLDEP